MRRRVIGGVLGLLLATVATACPPAPSPPPAYKAPTIDSVVASPSPAQPGDDVTLVVATSDDEGVTGVTLHKVITPSGSTLPGRIPCSSEMAPGAGVGDVMITVTCALPTFASNGTWRVELSLSDRPVGQNNYAYPGLRNRRISFEVAGGADDRSGPKLLEWHTDPAQPVRDRPFDVTLRFEDQAAPAVFDGLGFQVPLHTWSIDCKNPVVDQVAPTITEMTVTCIPDPRSSQLGLHRGVAHAVDQLGQARMHEIWINVVSG